MAIGNGRTSRLSAVKPFFVGALCVMTWSGTWGAAREDLVEQFVTYVYEGDLSSAQRLVSQGVDIHGTEANGNTALHMAALYGQSLEIVDWLLSIGADVNKPGSLGNTSMHMAVLGGRLNFLQALLAQPGTNINVTNQNGETLLWTAASEGKLHIVKWLLDKNAEVNALNNEGRSPVWAAAHNGRVDAVKELVEHGADARIADNKGETPLQSAISDRSCLIHVGYWKVVDYFVCNGGSGGLSLKQIIETPDQHSRTFLMRAARTGNSEKVVEWLLQKGANPHVEDKTGRTALWSAAMEGNLQAVKHLVYAGANINAVDKFGRTPLSIATEERKERVMQFLKGKGALLEAQKNDRVHSSDLDSVPSNPATATPTTTAATVGTAAGKDLEVELRDAVVKGNLANVKRLVEQGADVNARKKNGCTPLWIAARYGHLDVVQWLVGHGANITAARSDGATPLYIAAWAGKLDVVQWLAGQGVDVNAATNGGATPLDIARIKGHSEIVTCLEGVTSHFDQGREFYHKGLHKEAVLAFDRALKSNPEDNEVLMSKLQSCYALGNFNGVIEQATLLLSIYPNFSWAFLLMRAQAYIFLGNRSKATHDLQQTIAHAEREDVYALIAQALLDALSKKGKQAYDKLTKALKTLPNDPFVYLQRGKVALDAGKYRKAVTDFKKVIELLPGCVPAHKGLEKALSGLSRRKPSGNQAMHSREVEELREYVETMRQEMLRLHAESEQKFEESFVHQSEEIRQLTKLFSGSAQWQQQVEISDQNIDEIIRRIVQTENLAGWRRQIAQLDHQIEVLAEEQVEQKVALIQQKKALVKLVSKAEREEQIDEEKKYILADGKLRDFYLTMRIQLSSTYVGAQAIHSGFAEADTSSKASTILDVVGDSIPFSAVLGKLLGKLVSYRDVRKQRKAINHIMKLAPDSSQFNDVCETVARKLTFAKESEIKKIAPKAQPRGWFKKKLFKVKKKCKKLKQKLTVSSLDNLIKEEAAKIAEKILKEVMDGEIDEQLDVAEEMIDIIVVGGYQLLGPVQAVPFIDESDEDELMEKERRRLVTKRGVAGRRVPPGAQVTIAHRLEADRVKQQVARGEQITQRQQKEIDELKREREEQARKMAEMERKMELMMAMMEKGGSPAGNALFIPNTKKRLLTGVITRNMMQAPLLDVSRLCGTVSTEFFELLEAATDEYDVVVTNDPEMDAVAKSVTVEQDDTARSLIFIDDQFFAYLLIRDVKGDAGAIATLQYLLEHEKAHLVHEHSGTREELQSEEVGATVKGMRGLNDLQLQQATAFLHGWLERVEQFLKRGTENQRLYSRDDMQLFKHLVREMGGVCEHQRLHNAMEAITDAFVGMDSWYESYFADCGT